MTTTRKGDYFHGKSPRLAPDVRVEREKLADRAVKVLRKIGLEVQREEFGLRGGIGEQSWFVTLPDLQRFLLVVRDENKQRIVLSRRSTVEVQRTIDTLGFDEEGWPIREHAEGVVDLEEATWKPVGNG